MKPVPIPAEGESKQISDLAELVPRQADRAVGPKLQPQMTKLPVRFARLVGIGRLTQQQIASAGRKLSPPPM